MRVELAGVGWRVESRKNLFFWGGVVSSCGWLFLIWCFFWLGIGMMPMPWPIFYSDSHLTEILVVVSLTLSSLLIDWMCHDASNTFKAIQVES